MKCFLIPPLSVILSLEFTLTFGLVFGAQIRSLEVAALETAKASAKAALKGYRTILEGAQKLVDVGQHKLAVAAVKLSGAILSEYADATNKTKTAAACIVEHGLDSLISVKSAQFSGQFNAFTGGSFSTRVDYEFQKKANTVTVSFSTASLVQDIKNLVVEVLK